MHLKDRKSNNGPAVEWGKGDTPLKEILLTLRDRRYEIPVEIEHVGPDGPQAEIGRCLAYSKSILEK